MRQHAATATTKKKWAVLITMEDTNITAQGILVLYVLHNYEKFLIQEDLYGKEGRDSAVIQKELLPNTSSNREENTKMTENVLNSR